jgi:hypothetical protein
MRLEGLGNLKNVRNFIANRTLDLPACCIVPQLSTLLRARQTKMTDTLHEASNSYCSIPGHYKKKKSSGSGTGSIEPREYN